jgi:HlyD family secretion protein
MQNQQIMDSAIVGKSKKLKIASIVGLAILAFLLMAYFSLGRERSLNVERTHVTIREVSTQVFEDFMTFEARVEPLNSVLVNIVEGGSVQEIFAENGTRVTKGQPLARLYNPNSELGYMTQETAIIEQMNNLNNGKLNIRNQELGLIKDLASIEHDYNDAQRAHDMNKTLYEKGVISRNDWNAIQENFRYQTQRRNQITESIKSEKASNRIQIAQIDRSLNIMEKSLEVLRSNKKNFLVTAMESGTLTSFEPVIGMTYTAGQSIGKIDLHQGYKLVADVDEFYLEKIAVGQTGTIQYKGNPLNVKVIKVLPEVKGGRFQAELAFDGAQEITLQQGLTFGVRLTLSGQEQKVVIPRGQFLQETAGKWIFVVEGDKARRRDIQIGRENPDYYEIISGLKPGEKVITSSYMDYKEIEVLEFK